MVQEGYRLGETVHVKTAIQEPFSEAAWLGFSELQNKQRGNTDTREEQCESDRAKENPGSDRETNGRVAQMDAGPLGSDSLPGKEGDLRLRFTQMLTHNVTSGTLSQAEGSPASQVETPFSLLKLKSEPADWPGVLQDVWLRGLPSEYLRPSDWPKALLRTAPARGSQDDERQMSFHGRSSNVEAQARRARGRGARRNA